MTGETDRRKFDAERRQLIDDKFKEIDGRLDRLQLSMERNTEITTQVRDFLASFQVLGAVAKWCTAVGGLGVMVWHAVKEWKGL